MPPANPTEIPDFLTVAFDVKPAQVIAFFKAKGLTPSFAWQDMMGQEHAASFTVAKMMQTDLLADVRQAVDKAITEGKSKAWFQKELEPILQKAGWWGKKKVVDPLSGKTVSARLGSARRLETIYRTNMQSAYSVGHWDKIEQNQKTAPYLMYDAVDDNRVRADHLAWDGLVLPVEDSFWDAHYPPNSWNCRCSVIQMSKSQLEVNNLAPSKSPKIKTKRWKNPRTGQTRKVPVGVDPSFDYNPGKPFARQQRLNDALLEKIKVLPDAMQKPAAQGLLDALPKPKGDK